MSPERLASPSSRRKAAVSAGTLEYILAGQGRPTIVLLNGAGVTLEGWRHLLPGLAQLGTVLGYNRFGVGRSDRPRVPQTGEAVVQALRELLARLALQPPYLLVGHSLGGLYLQLFARQYPQEVAGALLLEATHPLDADALHAHEHQLARTLSKVLGVAQRLLRANLQSEVDWVRQAVRQVQGAGPFPPVPLAVVSGGKRPPAWIMSQEAWRQRQQLQRDLAALSPAGEHVTAAHSGHFPQLSEPQRVLEVVRRLAHAVAGGEAPGPAQPAMPFQNM